MDASKKQREEVAFKSLAELKRFIRPGVELKTVSHANHADIVGLTRVVTTVQTVGFYSKIKDQPEHPFSTCNHGKGFYTDFGKAGNYIFDGTTVKVKDARKQDRGVIYELEFYNREQNMEETMMDRKMVNFIKEQYPPGTRIRLNAMDDPHHPILPGTEGEVDFVDDEGQLHMKWDNGRSLALIPGEDMDKPWNKNMVARILEDDRYIGEKYFPALIPTEQFHAAQERRKEMRPEYKQTPAQKELRKLCGGIVPDSVARKVLKILNQVVDDPQLIKIESSGVPTTEDIRQRRLELAKLLQTPPVDEEIARQKAMELAVLTLVSVEMEEYEAHRLRSIFGKQTKLRDLDANLLKQGVRKIECCGDNVRVVLKNNQVLEERDQA